MGKFGDPYRPACLSGGVVYRYRFDNPAKLPECFVICTACPYSFRLDGRRIDGLCFHVWHTTHL
jgi:hypothetical protein